MPDKMEGDRERGASRSPPRRRAELHRGGKVGSARAAWECAVACGRVAYCGPWWDWERRGEGGWEGRAVDQSAG